MNLSKNTKLNFLQIDRNQIKGTAMDNLIQSMPVIYNDKGRFRVIYDENDQNVMTVTQVAAAKSKGWLPMTYDPETGFWKEYAGTTAINEVKTTGAAATGGKFLKDGKLVIKKDGQLFNASGTQLK